MESPELHVWDDSDVEEILSEDLLELNLSSFGRASGSLVNQPRLDGEKTAARALGAEVPATCGTVKYQDGAAASESNGHVLESRCGEDFDVMAKQSPINLTKLKNTGIQDFPEKSQHSMDFSVRSATLEPSLMLVPQSALVQADRGLQTNVKTYAQLPAQTVPAFKTKCDSCLCTALTKLFKRRDQSAKPNGGVQELPPPSLRSACHPAVRM